MDTEYIKVYSGNFFVVSRIIAKLENAGIIPITKDETESGRLAGFGASIQNFQEIYVTNDELNEAEIIVNRIKVEIEA